MRRLTRILFSLPHDSRFVDIVFDWRIRAEKPLFEANDRWAMAPSEGGLRQELAQRRAMSGRRSG